MHRREFAGTEFGCFVTLHGGKSWTPLMNNMPPVAFRDLVVHSRDNDLVAATHGRRSLWILDDIAPLQQLTEEVLASKVFHFRNRAATLWIDRSRGGQRGFQFFAGENPPSVVGPGNPIRQSFSNSALIAYYLKSNQSVIPVEVSDPEGKRKRTMTVDGKAGINRLRWNLRFDPTDAERAQAERRRAQFARPAGGEETEFAGDLAQGQRGALASPGEYLVRMTVGGKAFTTRLTVCRDPLLD